MRTPYTPEFRQQIVELVRACLRARGGKWPPVNDGSI